MKAFLPLALGLVGGILGALLVRAIEPDRAPARGAAPERTLVPATDPALERRLAEMERWRGEMESGGGGPSPSSTSPDTATEGSPPTGRAHAEGEGSGEGANASPEEDSELKDLPKWLKGRKIGPDETGELFEWLSKHRDKTADAIATILKEIEADPQNAELQVALATAYVADLWNNTKPGPQQGMVWQKAQAAYDAAIKLDPEHWQARSGKAFGTSMIPEFLGQRPAAIKQFEELLELQKRKPADPHFATTYYRLGTLYKDAGNVDKARETWNAGIAQYPDDAQLKEALETSTKK